MNPYATDPSLYGQYYHSMGQAPHGGPHGAYAAYYNAAAYASAQNSAATAHAVAAATGQPAAAASIPAYATPQTRPAQIVPQVTHNPQRALTTIHPTPTPTRNSVMKQGIFLQVVSVQRVLNIKSIETPIQMFTL